MGRAPCCDKANVKRGPWSPEEDSTLKSYIDQNGTGGNWIALPQKIGLKRCGKSCRLRWLNYLRPNIKHGGFSEEEDTLICSLYISIGSRWSIIAAQLPGRTDNDIKNYWNTRLKKKLIGKRKDQQQKRRICGAKQEAKRFENRDPVVDDDGGSRNLYWPDPSVPVYPISQADHRVDNEQASIRKLLIKLGGRFPNGDGESNQSPFGATSSVPPQQLYDDYANLIASSTHTLQDSAGFSMELDEIYNCDPVRMEGLDWFYGSTSMVDDGTRTSTSESANWCEVSPMIYPPMIPSYQGMPQYLSEDPVQLGMQ